MNINAEPSSSFYKTRGSNGPGSSHPVPTPLFPPRVSARRFLFTSVQVLAPGCGVFVLSLGGDVTTTDKSE